MSLSLAALMAASALAAASPVTPDAGPVPVAVDHHVHVHSPEVQALLPAYCASMGRAGPCPEVFINPPSLDDLLRQMDDAGVRRAHLMSSAYLVQSPMLVPAWPQAEDLVRKTNDHGIATAKLSQGRLVAFASFNPLSDMALSELDRLQGVEGASGLKLHLTNSGVDLRDPEHIQRLGEVFSAAARNGMAITIHMRTRAPDYGAQDVTAFLTQVRPKAAGVSVILAHAGGWGGLDEATWRALEAFALAFEQDPERHTDLFFELGQVIKADTPDEDIERLGKLMRRIGLDRFVVGSDWPFSGDLDTYLNQILERMALSPEERARLRQNQVDLRP